MLRLSLSHFEFIFVHSMRMCFNFIDLNAAVQLFQYHLLKRLSFSHFKLRSNILKPNKWWANKKTCTVRLNCFFCIQPSLQIAYSSVILCILKIFFIKEGSFTFSQLTSCKMEWPEIFLKWFLCVHPSVLLTLDGIACSVIRESLAHLEKCSHILFTPKI